MNRNIDLISIIVPCYNMENFIEKCIKSILAQTYKNIEVLVIDDGSTDNTKYKIKKIIQNDKRFLYYFKENGGLSDARNFGLKRAHGKYICFIDSDDYIEKNYIEEMYNSIIENDSDIAICDIKRIYDDHYTIDKINEKVVEMCMRPAAWNKLYKKELFDKNHIKFPIGKWYEDIGTTPKLTMLYKYSIVKEPLYNYVQNSSSIMHTYSDRIFEIYDTVENLEKYIKDKNVYTEKKDILEFINIYHILIGTIYRASFNKNFNITMIKKIVNYVVNKYPYWFKNKYIKSLPIFYRLFLMALKYKLYRLVYVCIKMFGKKIQL